MDAIFLKKLSFYGYHGVLPEETRLGQRFIVSLQLEMDLQAAAQSDDLTRTVNYADVADQVGKIVAGPPFQLLEALALNICGKLWESFPAITAITIEIEKPSPPIIHPLDSVGIRLHRQRSR